MKSKRYYIIRRSIKSTGLLPALLLCLPFWATAQIYQWQDADGNKHFSDRPVAEARPLDLTPGYAFLKVKTVYDGDTIELEDGRRIRFLGVNTPEIQHRDKPAEAGGDEAKRWLAAKLANAKVRLEIGNEKTDKYGRTLAHVFTENKEHINLKLVEAGLAAVNIYPAELLYVNELVKAQDKAESAKLGIWGRPEYAAIPVGELTEAGHQGWTRLIGKVTKISKTRKSVYLKFSPAVKLSAGSDADSSESATFSARIESKWLNLFPDVNSYLGKTIEVRGWLNKNKGRLSMLIRHPSAIKENVSLH